MQINFNIAFKNVSNKPAGCQERKGGADPFSRRATRPNIYWNTKGSNNKDQAAQQATEKVKDELVLVLVLVDLHVSVIKCTAAL
jgi:hypothetical protein